MRSDRGFLCDDGDDGDFELGETSFERLTAVFCLFCALETYNLITHYFQAYKYPINQMAPFLSSALSVAAFVGSSNNKAPLLLPVKKQSTILSLQPNLFLHNPTKGIDQSSTSCLHAAPVTTMIKRAPFGFSPEAIISMSLLALQFGLQPSLTRKFTPKTINRSTIVFTQDIVKFFMAGIALMVTGGWTEAVLGWNVKTWLTVAGIPVSNIIICRTTFENNVFIQHYGKN